jgi:predicted phosphoribosyltransferase
MRAALAAVRVQRPARLIAAAPVGARETCATLDTEADEVVCPATPEPFRAVGLWYRAFPQASDEEVRRLLAMSPPASTPSPLPSTGAPGPAP